MLSSPSADGEASGAVQRRDVIDLSSKLTADGKLNWHAPAGEWIILRAGYTPTGVNNHPAAYGGEGLECDKFSKAALDAHWAGFMQKILDDLGPLAGKTLDSSLIDSYEVGGQNWTENFRAEFQKRRGYDLTNFYPRSPVAWWTTRRCRSVSCGTCAAPSPICLRKITTAISPNSAGSTA